MDIRQIVYDSTMYIHRRYDEPITVMEISAQAYLSPSYFSSVFRIFTGFTVKNYVNRYRLYRAAVELKNSDKRIVEITFINGFSSQQAFTRSFSQMYGITPAKFRLLNPTLDPFPPKNLWEEPIPIMELMECFENVGFIHKDSFLAAGLEADINYHTEGGTDPIGGLWKSWNEEHLAKLIPNQTTPGITLGITCNETAEDTGKYIVCTEVSSLNNLPVGLVGRRFNECDYAVFNTTLDIIWTGEFWRTFYAKWLPSSGYKLPDTALHQGYATFNQYPAIEVYDLNHKDEKSILQIYAPIVKI